MSGEATLQMQVLEALTPGACLTTEQLAEMTGLRTKYVSHGACGLIRRSYVERKEIGCYQLTDAGTTAKQNGERLTCGPNRQDTCAKRPRRQTLRDRIWNGLRIKGRATLPELLENAGADAATSDANARKFLKALIGVGVVRKMPRRGAGDAPTSNGYIRYQLILNLGPKSPMVRKRGVLDPNSQTYLEADQ